MAKSAELDHQGRRRARFRDVLSGPAGGPCRSSPGHPSFSFDEEAGRGSLLVKQGIFHKVRRGVCDSLLAPELVQVRGGIAGTDRVDLETFLPELLC